MGIQEAFEKAVTKAKEYANNQERISDRDEVFSRYGKIFHPDNLDNLTREDFYSFFFLDSIRYI